MQLAEFKIKKSKILIHILLSIYCGVFGALFYAELLLLVKILATILLCIKLWLDIRKYFLFRASRSIVALRISPSDDKWYLYNHANTVFVGELRKDVVSTKLFLLLPFKIKNELSGKHYNLSLCIFKDSVDKTTFRTIKKFLL